MQSAYIINNKINEVEEGRRKVELAVCQVWRQRGRTRETCRLLYRSLKARLRYFLLKLVTITNEFDNIKKVIRLYSDGPGTLTQIR